MTLILNFAHPLTSEQLDQIAQLIGAAPDVRDINVHIDRERPLTEVARELAEAAGLAPADWQGLPLIVNPPGLAQLALALIAELHGRCGYFPTIVNIRPRAGALAPTYEVQELINLQAARDAARARR